MAERSPATGPDDRQGTPGWVKVFGVIAVVAVQLVVILLLVGGGHGPRRHTSSVDTRSWPVAADRIAPAEQHR